MLARRFVVMIPVIVVMSVLRRIRVMFGMNAGVMSALLFRERLDVARGEADLPLVRIDLDDACADRLTDMEMFVQLLARIAIHFRKVRQTFDTVGQTDEKTEVGDLRDRSDHFFPNGVDLREVVPLVRQELADRK